MKNSRLVWLLCLTVVGFATLCSLNQSQLFAEDSAQELKVMSFNIRYGTAKDGEDAWDHRKEFLVETINKFSPDLLGLQEVENFQKEFIAEHLKNYGVEAVGRNDGKLAGEMTAVFYHQARFEKLDHGHFWLSETPDVVGSKGWDTSLPRIASWVKLRDLKDPEHAEIYFLNTHFDHRGAVARAESSSLILKKISEFGANAKVIVTGDFNADPRSEPYKRLFEATPKLQDVYRVAHPVVSENEATFNGFKFDTIRGHRIDWVGATTGFDVVSATINRVSRENRYPSDHFPIEVVLKARNQ